MGEWDNQWVNPLSIYHGIVSSKYHGMVDSPINSMVMFHSFVNVDPPVSSKMAGWKMTIEISDFPFIKSPFSSGFSQLAMFDYQRVTHMLHL